MILAATVKICRVDDFWVGNDSIFINYFSNSSRLCMLTISTSAVEMCCIDDL